MPSDEKLLKEITDNFDHCVSYWQDIREQRRLDMQCISGDPWDPKERRFRESNGRLCLALDELNQYVNQTVNDVRQNKRAIKVNPVGNGATDLTAENRAGMLRQVEYKSNAQAAYLTAFQCAVEGSYGYFKIATDYEASDSFNQVLKIVRIPNPDTIYLDPDAKEADYSDMGYAFEIDSIRRTRFKQRWPDAEVTDFSTEHMDAAPSWIKEDKVQIASYWKVKIQRRTLVLFENDSKVFLDELPGAKIDKKTGFCQLADGARLRVINQRKTEDKSLCQYITNGVEILEENPLPGKWIPIIPVFGKEIYVDDGTGASKRVILSLTRLARDPYMLYCYARTCQAELAGMAPKMPIVGYEGQFDTATDWENINKIPVPYAEVKAFTTGTGQERLPLPQWQQWEPPIQALELLAEGARRAIQAAMGKYNTSVGKRDTAAQSGVAIQKLDEQADTGSFHLTDSFNQALEHAGRIMNDVLDAVYDSAREVGVRKGNDEYSTLKINQPATDAKTNQPMHFKTDEGEHDVTISTGPNQQSQRQAAQQFATVLAQNEAIFPRIADLIVKMQDLGALGDEIAERLEPPDVKAAKGGQQIPPQILARLQAAEHMVQHLQMLQASDALAQATKRYCADVGARAAVAVQMAKTGQEGAAEKMWAELEALDQQWQQEQARMAAATAATDAAAAPAPSGSSGDGGSQ